MFDDKLKEECGIFGGYCKNSNIAEFIKLGLQKLQHRGQESAGISTGGKTQKLYKANGLVEDVFDEKTISNLKGNFGIGHVRYSTQGGCEPCNAQPILINNLNKQVSIAHNGNIKAAKEIRQILQDKGVEFSSNSDTEVMLKKVSFDLHKEPQKWSFEEIGTCLNNNFSKTAFSVVFYLPNRILAYRDALGYRPLFFCESKHGYFIASEDVAFDMLNPIKTIEIQAGFGVEITSNGYEIKQFAPTQKEKKCVFEPIYFSSPASSVFGLNIYDARVELGKILAKNDNIDADIVIAVPNSGFAAAIGYSEKSKILFQKGLLLEKNSGRSFILPNRKSRVQKVKEKLTAIKSIVKDKKIILVDDSAVRGTTSKEVIKMFRNAGAKEVHFRLSSPMILNTCFWGVDIPTKEELLANSYTTEKKIAQYLGADSVKYLSINDLKEFFGETGWCYNCFMTNSSNCNEECGELKCNQPTKTPALV